MYKTYAMSEFKALGEESSGQFEAIVAVFNNVDRGGDMILPGAFTDTLAAWDAKGDPIPVIYSHQWDNLDAHIGKVIEAKETDDGLYVKAQLDMSEPFAARVYKKMLGRTLKEFSFAYDVAPGGGNQNEDVYELSALDLLEVGPTLVGMNPDTQLIAVKEMIEKTIDRDYLVGLVNDRIDYLAGIHAAAKDSNPSDEGEHEGEAGNGKSGGLDPSLWAAKINIDLKGM